ncbi:MAG: hypothetical protein LAT63_17490 [Marinobacter sp.]|nr:hypothetical protein [Marinobacter sp.]
MKTTTSAIALAALLMTGCGGGSNSSTPDPKTISALRTVAEAAPQTLNLNSEAGGRAVTLAEQPDDAVITSISVAGSEVTLQTADVDRPTVVDLLLAIEGSRDRIALQVLVENTSAASLESQVRTVLDSRNELLNNNEVVRVVGLLTNAQYMTLQITDSTRASMIASAPPCAAELAGAIAAFKALEDACPSDKQGELSDTELAPLQAAVQTAIDNTFSNAVTALNSISFAGNSTINLSVPPVTPTTFYNDERLPSRFIGNPALGEFDSNDNWAFDAEFDHLQLIMQ